MKFEYDFERIIDDFVFLCFFVGNDFLPNLPSLKIREGAIDQLIYLYKLTINEFDDYLTNKGELNLKDISKIFSKLAIIEEHFFRNQLTYKLNQAPRNNGKEDLAIKDFESIKANNGIERNKDEVFVDDLDLLIESKHILMLEGDDDDIKVIKPEDIARDRLNKAASENFQKILKESMKVTSNNCRRKRKRLWKHMLIMCDLEKKVGKPDIILINSKLHTRTENLLNW